MENNWFNSRKAAQVAAFFALQTGGRINLLKAVKLIYLAERKFLGEFEASMLRDQLVSMDYGPVNSKTLNHINGMALNPDGWREFISDRENYHFSVARPDISVASLDELSRAEVRILSETWAEFGGMDQWQLAEYTHKHCPEWEDPDGSSNPIPYSRVFKYLNKTNPEELEQKILLERKLESLLNT
ncbi:Panacea domain-containing protein [Devosia sp.]|uniref:Panacea domain-containing protein n=1 Tax=Devosia sp. TaxID=1871048 RepID=UPI001AD43207|nr:Panacea domain-containing protein [Devosia sp.]MBN9309307.1 SocA family protein [Devosia sp.]